MFHDIPSRTLCALAAGLCLAGAAQATTRVITTPDMNLENRNINSLGFTSGQFLRIGANPVPPTGWPAPSAWAPPPTTARWDRSTFNPTSPRTR